MPAHVPRKVFAKSFVVTVAAVPALALACSHEEPMSHNPPMPTETTSTSSTAPPTASADTASASASATPEQWTVSKNGAQCTATHGTESAPYACPANVPFNSYPLQVDRASGSQECKATFTDYGGGMDCPRGMHCNPPPPHLETKTVPCPK